MRSHTEYYDQEGRPIEGGTLAWAEMFEDIKSRIIGQSRTLYGEKLSTVWLGLNHNWGDGPPLIFESMLFAPDQDNVIRHSLWASSRAILGKQPEPEDAALLAAIEAHHAHVKKYYPHDQLQLRYSSREEAAKSHNRLWWACIIPPRWRRFILYTIGGNRVWN